MIGGYRAGGKGRLNIKTMTSTINTTTGWFFDGDFFNSPILESTFVEKSKPYILSDVGSAALSSPINSDTSMLTIGKL